MKFDTYETEQLYEEIKIRNNVNFVLYENQIFTSSDLLEFEKLMIKDIKRIKERNTSQNLKH